MNFFSSLAQSLPSVDRCWHRARWIAVALVFTLFCSSVVHAQPIGANVIAGTATITSGPGTTTVTASNNSVLQWSSFNLAPSETVQFVQPSTDSRVLNWIGGLAPSQIDGTIRANGQVYLINPAGVYFGQTAVIDAARIYAVAGSLSKEDFFAENDRFTNLVGDVRNEGSLRGSTVALIGRTVANTGTIVSPDGFVAMASGDQVFLGRKGSSIFVDTGAKSPSEAPVISSTPRVTNTGTIDAGEGTVALAAGDLYSVAISHTGQLRGREVRVQGQGRGDVLIDGTIDASRLADGQRGGSVEVTGDRVGLLAHATIDVSGTAGGGTILVGGDAHGANPEVRNAQSASVLKGAVLKADATENGQGGKAVVWSDHTTFFEGEINARGGRVGGAGGFAEVSGAYLTFRGTANLGAPHGAAGKLLLDPLNLTINNGADNNVVSTVGQPPIIFSPTASPSTLTWATILGILANSDVEIDTSTSTGPEAGNITIAASPLGAYNTSHALTLTSAQGGNITVSAPVISSGTGGLTLNSGGGIILQGAPGTTILSTNGTLSLFAQGSLTGPGVLASSSLINLGASLGIGTLVAPIVTSTPGLSIQGSGTSAHVVNTLDQGFILAYSGSLTGQLELISKDNSGLLDRPISLLLNGSFIPDLRVVGSDIQFSSLFSAGLLTVANSGSLILPSNTFADTLVLESSGNVGTALAPLLTGAGVLTFNKTGGNAYINVNGQNSFTVISGSSTNTLIDLSVNSQGQPSNAVIDTSSLTATSVSINAVAITLNGSINSATTTLNHSGNLSGDGILSSTTQLNLNGSGAVGDVDPVLTQTPSIVLAKTAPAPVSIINSNNAGLTLSGSGSGTTSVTTLDSTLQAGSPLTIGASGLIAVGGLTLSSSTLNLAGGITSPSISLDHSGLLSGPGTLSASQLLDFSGNGDVGTVGNPISTVTGSVGINKPTGSVFLNNGSNDLSIGFATFTGAGSFQGGNLTIFSESTPTDVGNNALTFISSQTLSASQQIIAGTLTLLNNGPLQFSIAPRATTLVLGGTGNAGDATSHFSTSANNLVLQKTGTAQVFVDNGLDAGLNVSGSANGALVLSSQNTARTAAAGITLAPAGGLSSGTAVTLTSSTLALGSPITSPSITLNATGAITGSGTLTASTQLTLGGAGNVGTGAALVATSTPSLVLNKPAGAVFLNNGASALTLTPTAFTGGGALRSGDFTLAGPIDVGLVNDLSFTATGSVTLGAHAIRANTLTLAHDGGLSVSSTGALTINTLVLGGAGDDGTAANPFIVDVSNLVLNKTGSANAYLSNRRDLGLTLSGSAGGNVGLTSLDLSGLNPAPLTIGSAGLTAGNSIALGASTVGLGGNLTSPDISLNHSAALSGAGLVAATTQVTFAGSGNVGTNLAPITTNTLSIALNKPAGAVYVNNGASGLSLSPIVFTGGGAFRSGSISLAAPLDVGTNPLDLTATTGALSFGTRSLTGGLVNLTSAGGMTGSGLLSATQLTLAGAGDVSFSNTRVPAVVLNKPTGAVVLNNGTTNLALTPTVFTGGGSFTGGNVSLLGPVNVGTNNLTLASSGILDLGSFAIQAATLTLAHDGVLANYAAPNVTTLNLGGSGDDGTATAFFTLATDNLVLSKTGAAKVYLENRRDPGVTLSGTANGLASIRSLNTSGTAAAGLTVGSSGLTVGGLLTLNSSTLALSGNLTAPDISLNHSAALSGAGTVAATTQLTFLGNGNVGTSVAPIATNTPSLAINKPVGAVYVNNGVSGLSLNPIVFTGGGAFRSGSISLAAPLDVGTNSLDLSATTGALSFGTSTLTGGLVTLASVGSMTGSGLISATRLTLAGTGDASLSNTRVPDVVLNKPTGAVVLNNGTANLTLTPTVFTGGGSFTGGNVSLLGPVNVGTNVFTLASSGVLDLGGFAIQANTLTLAHDGVLANYAAPNVTTLNLGGSGDDGSATAFFTLATDNLVLSKTGAANVYLENRRDPGVTLSGTTNGLASIRSLNTTGLAAAGLTVGSSGLTAGGPLTLSSSTLALSGLLTSPTVTVTNTGLLDGSGTIRASTLLALNGTGDVGTSGSSIATTTPAVTTNKSAGAVFLNNGTADLALTPTALSAGGSFSAGNLTLLSPLAAGTNAVTLNSTGTLNLGANALTGGAVTLMNGGALTGGGTITAAQLSLGGAGAVGTAGAPLSSRIPLLTVNKTTGAVYLDNGPLDLAFSATGFLGGGVLRSANLSLVGPVNSGGSSVSFITTGNIDFKGNAVTADLLNLSHNGSLLNLGSLTVNTLGLGGSGDDGTAATPFALSVPNLLLSKTGSANVFIENKRDLGLTVAGFANATVSVTSRNSAGTGPAQLTIGSGGLTTNGSPAALLASTAAAKSDTRIESDQAEGSISAVRKEGSIAAAADSTIILNVGDLVLSGGIDTATLTINNSGTVTGPGLLHATVQLNLGSTGNVGSAPSPIMANTPLIALNKSTGQVFINNNGMPLSVNPLVFTGGGAFDSGSFTLLGTIDVGTNDFTVTTTGDIILGSNPITGGKITFNNGGLLSGTALAVITGSSLVLDRNGNVGAAGAPLVFSGPTTDVHVQGSKSFVNISFSGGVQAELPIESKAVVATETHLAAAILEEERGVLPEADSASTPGRESRRGSGAAFRAIAAKADLASAAREQLQALGVYARPLRLEERLSRERKQAVFVTLPERERPKESDYEVVDARIDPAALREVLRLASEAGLTQTDKNRLEPVAKSLNATFTAFSAAFPTGEAAAFRSWLETRGDADSAIVLNFVKSLRSTIQKIELLGLTHQEIEVSKTQIFGSILRTQLNADPDFLRSLVETAPRPNSTASLSSAAGDHRIAAR